MTSTNIETIFPLSPTQQGILFHTLLAPDSKLYLLQSSCKLKGSLDLNAFERAWQRLIDRHQILRTAFVWEDVSEPIQVVGRRAQLNIRKEDWCDFAETEVQQRLTSFLRDDREHGFAFSKAPLMRVALFRLADDLYHLTWTSHHLILDGWSQGLMLKEFFTHYRNYVDGKEPVLAPLRPFKDYVGWLRAQDMAEAESYWRQTLQGFSAATPLVVDRLPQQFVTTTDTDECTESLSVATTDILRTFARRNQLTLNTLVQASWAILLSRYSGEDDVLFGALTSGRSAGLSGVESIIGPFVNTLPVRVKIDSEMRLITWLKKLQEQQIEMRKYEFSPLVQVQGWSEVPRGEPLFETLLDFENFPIESRQDEGLGDLVASNDGFLVRTNYPLELIAMPGETFVLKLRYDPKRLSGGPASRMIAHLDTIMESIAAKPDCRLGELSMLTETEEHLMVTEWNRTATEPFQTVSFLEEFESQASRVADRIAVECDGHYVSYDALNQSASRVGQHLSNGGIGPESVVAVMNDRGIGFLTSVLAVFKAGAAYLPLDPYHPAVRLAREIKLGCVRSVLAAEKFLPIMSEVQSMLDPEERPDVYTFERLMPAFPQDDQHRTTAALKNLAYVIFTSGSTGLPKGAMIEHAGMVNHLLAKIDDLRMTEHDVVAQTASQCFDISVWQMLTPLMIGARLCILTDEITHDPQALFEQVRLRDVSVLEIVPSILRALPDSSSALDSSSMALPNLRWLIATGEALPRDLATSWKTAFPDISLLNAYGPTECSDDVTHYEVPANIEDNHGSVPIGKPIRNTSLYVVDRQDRAVPIGVNGELLVGGIGVGRGYLNDPARTAVVFQPDTFGGRPGSRLYKTGDLVHYLEDGSVDFIGRIDYQVKVRGFRIELGEIEAALLEHPNVREAVVIAREIRQGENAMIGFIVSVDTVPTAISELKEFLKRTLPDYMVPAIFVPLSVIPLTPNGKTDRQALPPIDLRQFEQNENYIPPGTNTERTLVEIWRDVLKVEKIGIRDDFFVLGGHSLLATQLISRVRSKFAAEVGLADFFRTPTIEALAATVEELLIARSNPDKIDELLRQLEAMDD